MDSITLNWNDFNETKPTKDKFVLFYFPEESQEGRYAWGTYSPREFYGRKDGSLVVTDTQHVINIEGDEYVFDQPVFWAELPLE